MKAKIKEYTGPNKAVCEIGGKEATVRIPVNIPHPADGETFEVKNSWILKPVKADKPAKPVKADKPAPVEVKERGEITPDPEK